MGDVQLYLSDPAGLDHVLVKSGYEGFEEQESSIVTNLIMFGEGIASHTGRAHKERRSRIYPFFTVNALRKQELIFARLAHEVRDKIASKVDSAGKDGLDIDILNWMSRTGLEYIAQAALGYSFDALNETRTHPYVEAAKFLLPNIFRIAVAIDWLYWLAYIGSKSFRRVLVNIAPFQAIKELARVIDVMDSHVTDLVTSRKIALENEMKNESVGNDRGEDILSLLLRHNAKSAENEKISEVELRGQVSALVFAGSDTTSTGMTRILEVLAHDIRRQSKLRAEIVAARAQAGGKELTFDELHNLPYLDAVVREVLRLYPPISQRVRVALKDTMVPLHYPVEGKNGRELNEIFVPKGTWVQCSQRGVNRDLRTWGPDGRKFVPERWLGELPKSVVDARVPGNLSNNMVFFAGPRACMGFKFAIYEMKLMIATLLSEFEFCPGSRPSKWDLSVVLMPVLEDEPERPPGLYLHVTRIPMNK